MQVLEVIGHEDGHLILSAEDGTRFRLGVDDSLYSLVREALRSTRAEAVAGVGGAGTVAEASPKEIQALIRAGMPAEQIAQELDTSLERVRRFEPPVLAERSHFAELALGTRVGHQSFGEALLESLQEVEEYEVSAKKDDSNWVVEVEYLARGERVLAKWRFDHKSLVLYPLNRSAAALVSETPDSLSGFAATVELDNFADSAYAPDSTAHESIFDNVPAAAPISDIAVNRSLEEEESTPLDDSAERLIDSLRRRKQEVEAEPQTFLRAVDPPADRALAERMADRTLTDRNPVDRNPAERPDLNSVERPDRNLADRWAESQQSDFYNSDPAQRDFDPSQQSLEAKRRMDIDKEDDERPISKGRTSVPSWDEILFGNNSDKDKN